RLDPLRNGWPPRGFAGRNEVLCVAHTTSPTSPGRATPRASPKAGVAGASACSEGLGWGSIPCPSHTLSFRARVENLFFASFPNSVRQSVGQRAGKSGFWDKLQLNAQFSSARDSIRPRTWH